MTLHEIQAALNRAGASPRLDKDGLIGKKTRRAIRAFQAAKGLPATGQAGPRTIKTLLRV